jgi:hypothetical protein
MLQEAPILRWLPVVLALMLALVSPYILPSGWSGVVPPFAFAMLFYWRYRRNFPLIVVVTMGAMLDIQQAMPLGVGISASLLLAGLAQYRFEREVEKNRSFAFSWAWFSAASFVTLGWIYLLMCVTQQALFPLFSPLFQWALLVASYPILYRFCHALLQWLDPQQA